MPNYDQLKYLDERCVGEWATLNGFPSMIYRSPIGTSLFLPASEIFVDDTKIRWKESTSYWSSTPVSLDEVGCLHFREPGRTYWSKGYRPICMCVLPVAK